jgi:hypothetical protein
VNKRQKVSTIVALIAFIAIGAFHYLHMYHAYPHTSGLPWVEITDPTHAILPDVKMPWFLLGVIYAGLFFLLQSKRGS